MELQVQAGYSGVWTTKKNGLHGSFSNLHITTTSMHGELSTPSSVSITHTQAESSVLHGRIYITSLDGSGQIRSFCLPFSTTWAYSKRLPFQQWCISSTWRGGFILPNQWCNSMYTHVQSEINVALTWVIEWESVGEVAVPPIPKLETSWPIAAAINLAMLSQSACQLQTHITIAWTGMQKCSENRIIEQHGRHGKFLIHLKRETCWYRGIYWLNSNSGKVGVCHFGKKI